MGSNNSICPIGVPHPTPPCLKRLRTQNDKEGTFFSYKHACCFHFETWEIYFESLELYFLTFKINNMRVQIKKEVRGNEIENADKGIIFLTPQIHKISPHSFTMLKTFINFATT